VAAEARKALRSAARMAGRSRGLALEQERSVGPKLKLMRAYVLTMSRPGVPVDAVRGRVRPVALGGDGSFQSW
jgi:hypothetical protein